VTILLLESLIRLLSAPGKATICDHAIPWAAAVLCHFSHAEIPESLAAVSVKAMARGKEGRYQTVQELQREIEAYLSGFATSANRLTRCDCCCC
jgi:hypothetical protein